MEASIVDLRYKMNDLLKALERREKVKILYHGKLKGTIVPTAKTASMRVREHPFFGMTSGETESVQDKMAQLRRPRY